MQTACRPAAWPIRTSRSGAWSEGDKVEIERALGFNLMALLTLPWRAQWAGQQTELARLQAAQDVVRLAADTRKAWVQAVAAQQIGALHARRHAGRRGRCRTGAAHGAGRQLEPAEPGARAEFPGRCHGAAGAAEQDALASREQLTRLMGLWGAQTAFTLPDRLPDLPASARVLTDVEAQAISQRLDVPVPACARRSFVAGIRSASRARHRFHQWTA